MKQTVEEAAYQNEQKMLIDADIRVSEEEASYYEGLRDGIMESASKSFIAGAEWQQKQSPWISVDKQLPDVNTVVLTKGAYGYLICFLSTLGEWEIGAHVNEELLGITHWMPIPKFNE